jgi:ProP effector
LPAIAPAACRLLNGQAGQPVYAKRDEMTGHAVETPVAPDDAPQALIIASRANCYNPRIFLVVDCIMGFEQLAALKEQLAKQAEEKRNARRAQHPKPAQQHAKPAKQGDAPAPKQARAAKPERPARPGSNAPAANRHAQQQKAPAHKSAPAQKSKPVDPVVLSIGKLQKRFPKTFPKNPAPKVPLKVGIFQDLLQHSEELGLDEAALREAIKVWCWGSRYWACVTENAMRKDLNGEDAGQVLPAEAARARGLQAKRQKTKNAAQAAAPAAATGQEGEAAAQGETAAQSQATAVAPQAAGEPEPNEKEEAAVQQDEAAQQDGAA